MSRFSHIDTDGDRLRAYFDDQDEEAVISAMHDGRSHMVALTKDAARDLAAKLTAWAGPAKPAPEFKVGDSVEVTSMHYPSWNGIGTIVNLWADGGIDVRFDRDLDRQGTFSATDVSHYTPNYAALAAEFKPGDLAIVGNNPGIGAQPGNGFVSAAYRGKAVNVLRVESDGVLVVALYGDPDGQYIHVAHLTKAKAVPA
ncbi:hypothetical protein HPO96_37175 [Kribbella sandramycini]|uniref:Uncharacterized protein n=1 Tax=Kribbella sandramycini TaxID=60450 RepID=A0A7Y4L7N9_9ACTN|nr:hypothetical protein [Kribbella sandramycini]MBB6564435.1 hypothetical protein [Kribbella sandramycini]NOL45893.1 hypothetical protein [Kribbella sandramycini]